MMEPLYAIHRDDGGAILAAGTFDYSYKLTDWLKSLDIRAGDKIEFGQAAKRPIEAAPETKLQAA